MAAAFNRDPASLDALLANRRVWRGQPAALPPARHPTGFAALDAALPAHGWPDAALSEVLLPADGIGELRLLLPTLARLTQAGQDIVLVAPPCIPYPEGWQQAGVDFAHVHVIDASPRDALWATEQCLRAGCLAAALCWPRRVDDRALRRLQVACESGQALGFAFRDAKETRNPSPAALRVLFERGDDGVQLRVLKCRGGNVPTRAIALDAAFPGVARTRPQAASGEDRLVHVAPAGPAQTHPGCAALARATLQRDAVPLPATRGEDDAPGVGSPTVPSIPRAAGRTTALRVAGIHRSMAKVEDLPFSPQRGKTEPGERMRGALPAARIEEACA